MDTYLKICESRLGKGNSNSRNHRNDRINMSNRTNRSDRTNGSGRTNSKDRSNRVLLSLLRSNRALLSLMPHTTKQARASWLINNYDRILGYIQKPVEKPHLENIKPETKNYLVNGYILKEGRCESRLGKGNNNGRNHRSERNNMSNRTKMSNRTNWSDRTNGNGRTNNKDRINRVLLSLLRSNRALLSLMSHTTKQVRALWLIDSYDGNLG